MESPRNGQNEEEMTPPESTNKTRILFVITKAELGGAYMFLVRLVSQLDRTLFEVHVALGVEGDASIVKLLPSEVRTYAVSHLVRDVHPLHDIRATGELVRILESVKPDILFLNSSKAGFLGSIAAKFSSSKLPSMKVIYRIGGWTFNDPWPNWKKILYRNLERWSAIWKDYIIVNSRLDLEAAKTYKIKPRQEVILIHNGIDPYLSFLDRDTARTKLAELAGPVLGSKFIIGTIANFYPAKNLATLIHTASLLPESVHIVIIGDGPLRDQLLALIKDKKLQDKVSLVGRLADAHKYLPAFDCLVIPSAKEGFPWVALEAMAAKVPVIATRVGAIPEIITSGTNGFIVEAGQSTAIAKIVTELVNNDRLRQEIAIQAHQTIIKSFTLNEMVTRYQNFFRQAANKDRS